MKRSLLTPILVAALLCGCGAEQNTPRTPARGPAKKKDAARSGSAKARRPGSARAGGPSTRSPAPGAKGPYVDLAAVGVRMVRPEGFDDAESFHGFQQPDSQSSVMATLIPGPFSKVTAGFTTDQMKARGMKLRSKEEIEIGGQTGLLMNVTQTAYGTEFAKWIVVLGDEKKTVTVAATFPKSLESEMSAKLKSVVLSTRPIKGPLPGPTTGMPFTIIPSEKLKAARGIGKMLLYTKDGVLPAKSPDDPLFIAAPSLGEAPIVDKRQYAIKRLHQTAKTKVSSVISNDPITIDGLEGYEIVAGAEDKESGRPLVLYQVILYDGRAYVLMQGLVGAALGDEYLPEFKKMARSLKRRAR